MSERVPLVSRIAGSPWSISWLFGDSAKLPISPLTNRVFHGRLPFSASTSAMPEKFEVFWLNTVYRTVGAVPELTLSAAPPVFRAKAEFAMANVAPLANEIVVPSGRRPPGHAVGHRAGDRVEVHRAARRAGVVVLEQGVLDDEVAVPRVQAAAADRLAAGELVPADRGGGQQIDVEVAAVDVGLVVREDVEGDPGPAGEDHEAAAALGGVVPLEHVVGHEGMTPRTGARRRRRPRWCSR